MADVTVFLKPTWSSCRKSVDFLKRKKVAFETVDLFKKPLTAAQLGELCRKLGVSPREILRTKDPAYDENDLGSGKQSDARLLELMAKNPGLVQRPIVVKGGRAVVARPAEAVEDLLRW